MQGKTRRESRRDVPIFQEIEKPQVLTAGSLLAPSSTCAKRSFNDENSDPQLLSPTKRVKPLDNSPVLKEEILETVKKVSASTANLNAIMSARRVLQEKNTPFMPRANGVKRGFGDGLEKAPVNSSFNRKVIATPKSKLAKLSQTQQKRLSVGKAIAPPLNSPRLSSIDAAFSKRKSNASTTSSTLDYEVTITPMAQSSMPSSWFFDIHEDTAEEALENLMEFSTGILDISDDSDDDMHKLPSHELVTKGKENIPPERLAELLSGLADEKAQMAPPPRPIIQKKAAGAGPNGKMLRERREALKGLEIEKFYPVKKAENVKVSEETRKEEKEKKEKSFFTRKQKSAQPEFMIWESSPSPEPESREEAV